MADIARTLTAERGDSADAELLTWAEAVRRGHRESCTRSRHGDSLGAACLWQCSASTGRRTPEQELSFDDDGAFFSLGPDPGRYAGPLRKRHRRTHDAPRALGYRRRRTEGCSYTNRCDHRESRAFCRSLRSAGPPPFNARQLTKTMFDAMEFGFLFDPTRKLFSIGYRVADNSLDPSCYDLLASEARLTSFIAIAKGDVPSTHWFHLGRALTPVDRGSALVSWSGSMFEYLMPVLVMRSPSGSLLGQTYHLIVRRQRKYGTERGVPWGVSESAYNARDLELTYQYSNFGVPGLGLKRGLSEDVVVAPYATALAAMIDPKAAAENFIRLAEAGASGRYGFYEALDYTATRVPEDQARGRRARLYGTSSGDVARGARKRPP